jgi:hypothetical protein
MGLSSSQTEAAGAGAGAGAAWGFGVVRSGLVFFALALAVCFFVLAPGAAVVGGVALAAALTFWGDGVWFRPGWRCSVVVSGAVLSWTF